MNNNINNEDDNKFYTCKYDRVFKEIITKLSNRDILKLILEKILDVSITNIKINNVERNSGNLKIRRKNVDALLTTNVGKIEIEVNAFNKPYVHPRNASYICDIYSHNVLVKQEYTEDIQVIQINLSYGIEEEKCMRIYKLQDEEGKTYVKNLIIYDVNMEYYKSLWYSKNEKEIEENKYMIMLDLEKEELEEISKRDKVVHKYMEDIVKLNGNPEFREFMTYEMDKQIIHNTELAEAEKKGLKQGIEKGIKKGIKQGRVEGEKRGEKNKSIEIARTMLKEKIDINTIIKCTGLTKEEIENL